ncbi:MAG: extracellular solute-binding protein [Campylobacterales bacterium]|nr:extracellular solute-binding protein [Campylobacterales bacterium]
MKRFVSWVLILALSVSVVGCSSISSVTSSQGPEKIVFWHGLGGSLGEGLNTIIDAFNEEQDDYFVEPVVIGSYLEIDERLQAAFAANNAPALVAGGSHEMFYSKGLVAYFEDYMPSDYDIEDIVGGFKEAAYRNGKMAFAPAYGTSQVLYYNKAVLGEVGKTRENLASWQKIADLRNHVIGIETGQGTLEYVWEPMWGQDNIADMASSNGGRFLSEDGSMVTINSPEWVEVLEQVRVWLHDDQIMRIHSGGQGWEYWYKTMDDWVYGKALGYTGSPGDYVIALEAVQNAVEEGVKNDFAVVHQPGWKENQPRPYFSSLMYYIPNSRNVTDSQRKGAAAFINFATNTENTANFAMASGYAAVRNSVLELETYKAYLKSNPDADAALKQIDLYAVPAFIDPTGGAIISALSEAVDRVQIENVSAQKALDDAQAIAQRALEQAGNK